MPHKGIAYCHLDGDGQHYARLDLSGNAIAFGIAFKVILIEL